MAIAFHRQINDVTYEVRTAGRSIRLYTNGAFHSQYNPAHLFTGAVWDLLALPSLSMDIPASNVLVLGVGGGTVIHQLDALHSLKKVTGIELDPMHIRIAVKLFQLRYRHTELIQADARNWLETSRATFDYIVDDVYLHGEVDPKRPFYPDRQWCELLATHLKPGGAVVQNHIDASNARAGRENFSNQFAQTLVFGNAMYSNAVVAGFKTGATRVALKKRCRSRLACLPKSVTRRLRHRIS